MTSADGTWMTRGFHSKNATFSMRNYLTGALLYYVHLCQRGRNKVIHKELLPGYVQGCQGLRCSPCVKEGKRGRDEHRGSLAGCCFLLLQCCPGTFSDAEVMICGGHAGRAHMKRLDKFAKN